MTLYLNTQQSYRAGGRLGWAAELAKKGSVAMDRGEYAAAAKLLQESAEAYPHPRTLRMLGICLLLGRKPADAVIYLAAAVELSSPSRRTRPRLLLAKALLIAGNDSRCDRLLNITQKVFPEVIRVGTAEVLKGKRDRNKFHRLIDELLNLIPEEHDASEAAKDPPVDYGRLLTIYCQSGGSDSEAAG